VWVAHDTPLYLPDFKDGDSEFSQIEYLGQGGMGIVYKAYHNNFERWVALKFCSPSNTASAADRERFRAEAQSMARLRHPNIVTVHQTGEYQGRPYFIMELIEGKSLQERVDEFVDRPRDAAALVETIALAVHHAHQRRILHNDLKPANILMDEDGQPNVTDFGLARKFDEGGASPATGAVEGTASYMSPEQIDGREITTASDVHGLGAVSYTLLTGRAPFRGKTVKEILELVRDEDPTPPRALNPKVDSDLQAICLCCLKKPRSERYISASSLAHDLGRYLKRYQTVARPWTRREQVVSWGRRNKIEAGLVTGVITVWTFVIVMALSVAQAQKDHRLQATVEGVSFAAKNLAQTALLQLRYFGRNIELVTADPSLATRLINDDREGLREVVFGLCGNVYKFAISAPILDRQNNFLGTIATSVATDKVMGRVFEHDDRRKVALIAPADINDPKEPRTDKHVILYHPGYRKGADPVEFPLRDKIRMSTRGMSSETLTQADPKLVVFHNDNYSDPVAAVDPSYAGRWIAGFAPVGNTGFMVVVQQRFEEAVSLEHTTLLSLALFSALTSMVVVAILLIVMWQWARSRKLEVSMQHNGAP